MDQILNQLGELVLGSVPTMVLFILLVAAYVLLVRRPLDRILAERRARTSGAEPLLFDCTGDCAADCTADCAGVEFVRDNTREAAIRAKIVFIDYC